MKEILDKDSYGDMVLWNGQMVVNILVNFKKINDMVLEHINGIIEHIQENGLMDNNMEKEYI